jgi:hypothetical protein
VLHSRRGPGVSLVKSARFVHNVVLSFCRALDSVILLSLLPFYCIPSHFPCPCSSCSSCKQFITPQALQNSYLSTNYTRQKRFGGSPLPVLPNGLHQQRLSQPGAYWHPSSAAIGDPWAVQQAGRDPLVGNCGMRSSIQPHSIAIYFCGKRQS